MEVHQLRYFVAVTEDGSFSRAAVRMSVAQPSLSQQIQKLEAEVGQPLFDRLPRNVTPTEAGQRLLVYARRILADLADARRCVEEQGEGTVGTVAVGILPTIAPYILRKTMDVFRAEHPNVAIRVLEDVTDRLVRELDEGAIDLAIVSTCRGSRGVHRERWASEVLLAAVPENHPLAGRKKVGWPDLAKEPLLMLHETHCLAQQIGRWCGRHGPAVHPTLPAAQLCTALAMVAAGMGISIVPAMAASREKGDGCVFIPLAGDPPEREINAIRNPARYFSRAAAAFSDVASRVVREIVSG